MYEIINVFRGARDTYFEVEVPSRLTQETLNSLYKKLDMYTHNTGEGVVVFLISTGFPRPMSHN